MKSRYSTSRHSYTDRKEPSIQFPAQALLYIGLMSMSVIFVVLSASLVYTHFDSPQKGFRLPIIFHINTLVIVLSSLVLNQALIALRKDQSTKFRNLLGVTFALGCCFLAFQFIGWTELFRNGINLTINQSASYLYVVSGLHAMHVLVGVVILGYCFAKSLLRINNPVADLMFVTDPTKKMRIGLVAKYWHFVDVLWVYLYVLFLLMLI